MSTKVRFPKARPRPRADAIRARFSPNRRGWVLLAVAGVLALSFGADMAASAGRVRSGIEVGSLQIGGKTRQQAERMLGSRAERLASEHVVLTAKGEQLLIQPEDVGYFPDVDATLDRALGVGREGNILQRFWARLRTYFVTTDVGWVSDAEDETVKGLVVGWAERFDDPGREAGIEFADGNFRAVEGVSGRRLDQSDARATLIGAIETWPRKAQPLPFSVRSPKTDLEDAQAAVAAASEIISGGPITLTAPQGTVDLTPEEIAPLLDAVPREASGGWTLRVRFSPERVSSELGERMKQFEQEPVSAKLVPSGGTVQVVPSQEGLVFDADKTAAALTTAADDPAPRNAEVAFTRTEPKLTTEEAKALGVKELVSTFTTRHPCCAPRVKNIHRIADIVDGAIVRPGATFSLNQYAGKRTTDRGFVLAPMIFDGEYKDDVGGGVSQFATTFYNAVFFGGYKAAYHKAHSYYISRYPPGREATVSWPHPDLKFVNDSPAGILIKTSYSSTSITVSFYGDKQGKTVTSETGERTNFTDPPTQRKANAAMAPGSERTVQRGSRGFDITVWRITKTADGDTRKEKFFTRYKPEPTIVEYGPGTPAPTSPEPSPDQPGSPEPPDTPRPPATPPGSTQGPSNP